MKINIVELQKRVGTIPDGIWGPKSIAACQAHLKALMPKKNPWPTYKQRIAFYGPPGNVSTLRIPLPEKLFLYGNPQSPIDSFSVHFRCAESLQRIFRDIHNRGLWGKIVSYDGCCNNRSVHGSTAISNHAWCAAVDLNHYTNGNYTHWPTVADFPIEIMECFAREGWYSAGAFWSRDAMHQEAVQP